MRKIDHVIKCVLRHDSSKSTLVSSETFYRLEKRFMNEEMLEVMSEQEVKSIRHRFIGTQIAALCDSHELLVKTVEQLSKIIKEKDNAERKELDPFGLQQLVPSSL